MNQLVANRSSACTSGTYIQYKRIRTNRMHFCYFLRQVSFVWSCYRVSYVNPTHHMNILGSLRCVARSTDHKSSFWVDGVAITLMLLFCATCFTEANTDFFTLDTGIWLFLVKIQWINDCAFFVKFDAIFTCRKIESCSDITNQTANVHLKSKWKIHDSTLWTKLA